MAKVHSALNIDLDAALFITSWLEPASTLAFHLCLYYLNSVSARRGSRSARKQATQYAFLCLFIYLFFLLTCFVSCFVFGCEKRMRAMDGSLDNSVARVLCKRKPFMKLLSTRATATPTHTHTGQQQHAGSLDLGDMLTRVSCDDGNGRLGSHLLARLVG